MSNLIRNTIGKNVKAIRKSLNISQHDFSILTELSRASIVNIESGKKGYNLNLLDNIISFTTYTLKQLSDEDLVVSYELRDKLLRRYKSNPSVYNLLSQTPELWYAIHTKLLNSEFIIAAREIGEIKSFFDDLGWNYLGTSISNSLKGMPEYIEISKHPSKGNTNVYKKRG